MGESAHEAKVTAFGEGLEQAGRERTSWAWVTLTMVGDVGSCTYLGPREFRGQPAALVRIMPEDGGVDYRWFVIDRAASPDAASDMFVGSGGALMSEVMASILPTVADELDDRGTGPQGNRDDGLIGYSQAARTGDQAKIHARCATLKREVRQHEWLAAACAYAASSASDAAYIRAMKRFRRAFPSSMALALMSLDHHFLVGKAGAFRDAITILDDQLGGDPFLQHLVAHAHLMEGRTDDALAAALVAVDRAPEASETWFTLIEAAMTAARYDVVARGLDGVESVGWIMQIEHEPFYAPFVASPEGQAWLDARRVPPADAAD